MQGNQGSQEKNALNDFNEKQWDPEEAKLENRKTNHVISESNDDGDETKLGINVSKGEHANFVEVKLTGKTIISLRE